MRSCGTCGFILSKIENLKYVSKLERVIHAFSVNDLTMISS